MEEVFKGQPGNYQLKWSLHGGILNSSISKLYCSNEFADVLLATADGQHVSAHQIVLSACSSYLHKMLCVGNKNSKVFSKIIIVLPPEISHRTLSVLLQYIYQGEVVVQHDLLPHLMKAAEILKIKGLCPEKDKDKKSGSSSILNQHNKNSSDLKNNSEKTKPSFKVLIPEVTYGGKPTSVKNMNLNRSPISVNDLSRSSSLSPSLVLKKQKGNPVEVLSGTNSKSMEKKLVTDNLNREEEILAEVKEEPVDWEEQKSTDDDVSSIKQETMSDEEIDVEENKVYVPLTCDLCLKIYPTPALWFRHIEQNHPSTALASGKRSADDEQSTKEYPPLNCEICQKVFLVPAEWVKHVQSHTEDQWAEHNQNSSDGQDMSSELQKSRRFQCRICAKELPSQASMQIHSRTHTGECPYKCKICGRNFNVKSNYVRHMRTLHGRTFHFGPLSN